MCRYAFKNYKSHLSCFECRKVFKKISYEDYLVNKGVSGQFKKIDRFFPSKEEKRDAIAHNEQLNEQYRKLYFLEVSVCPECKGVMSPMGLDFKAPKKADVEAWEIIKQLYNNGYAFQGCGCYVGYAPPSKVSQIESWLHEHARESESEKLLKLFKLRRA